MSLQYLYSGYLRSRFKEEALTLFLLFDQIVLPTDHKDFSIPLLEEVGYVRFHKSPEILQDLFSHSDWYMNRDRKAFATALALVIENKSFILPIFIGLQNEFVSYISRVTKTPKLKLIELVIYFAYCYYTYDKFSPLEHRLSELLSDEVISLIASALDRCEPRDGLNSVDAVNWCDDYRRTARHVKTTFCGT